MKTGCFRCGGTTHWQADCPLLNVASTEADHMTRIRLYIDRWVDGHCTLEQKRVAISLENKLWYGDGVRRSLTYP